MYKLECAVWEFTLACNMNCMHCGSKAGSRRQYELSTSECFILGEELAELNCKNVCLMGGEPFMRDDWFYVANCIKDLGMELSFVSNGLLIPSIISKLAQIDPKVVGISLDGTQQVHDAIRCKGSFASVINAIKLLREANIQTTIITTLTKQNFNELPALKDLLIKTGVNWQIQIGLPFGNLDASLVIDKEEYYASAMFITANRIKNKFEDLPVVGAHCYGFFSHILPNNKKWNGCTAGISTLGITSDGSIVGCLSMGNDQFIEGNIRKRRLCDIWTDSKTFAYNRRISVNDFGDYCRDCPKKMVCKGGCNSVSIHLTKEFHNNPLCFRKIEEEEFSIKPSWREKIFS